MLRLFRSLARSITAAVRHDPEVERLIAAHPQVLRFLTARFDRDRPLGLRFTGGAAISLFFLFLFFGVIEDLLARDPLVEADIRIVAVAQMFRAPGLDRIMLLFTDLGNWQVVLMGGALLSLWFALSRRWLWILALIASTALGEGSVWALKALFNRPRPDLVHALVPAQGASFPSGHAFVAFAFYGLAAWFVIRLARAAWLRGLILVIALAVAAMIGVSRIYLGVHWPSDVLASFAFGMAWLAITVTLLGTAQPQSADLRPFFSGGLRWAAATGLAGLWAIGLAIYYQAHPLERQPEPPQVAVDIPESALPDALFSSASRFSEDIVGRPMEPINVILIGSEKDVEKALASAGWHPTDAITLSNSWRLLGAELFNRPYPEAPGTPSFWRGIPNLRAFERPTESNSARERHHLHLWETPYRVGGVAVSVGTVHRDTSVTTAAGVLLPIHQIDPNVDRERDALRENLSGSPCTARLSLPPIIQPMMGENAIGNPFFTDGKAVLAVLGPAC